MLLCSLSNMAYCREEGKDKIIFATKEDLEQPTSALITIEDQDEEPGLILDNGDINWNCPCLGGMASGPCGMQFREAFSCFHYSETDPKGSDCYEQFKTMQDCMTGYPELYPSKDDDDDETNNALLTGKQDDFFNTENSEPEKSTADVKS